MFGIAVPQVRPWTETSPSRASMSFRGRRQAVSGQLKPLFESVARASDSRLWLGLSLWFLLVGVITQTLIPLTLIAVSPDSGGFQAIALELLARMQTGGWSAWHLWPEQQAPAGISAAIYYATGMTSPIVVLPLLSATHATSAVILEKLVRGGLGGRPTYRLPALLMALLPSSLVIVSTVHKDAFSILGIFCILYAFHKIRDGVSRPTSWTSLAVATALLIFGAVLIFVVRAYLLHLVLAGAIVLSAAMLAGRLLDSRRVGGDLVRLAGGLVCALVLLVAIIRILSLTAALPDGTMANDDIQVQAEAAPVASLPIASASLSVAVTQPVSAGTSEQPNPVRTVEATPALPAAVPCAVPEFVRGRSRVLIDVREHLLLMAPTAYSNIDAAVRLESGCDIAAYAPRAMEIGMLSPFPAMWLGAAGSHQSGLAIAISAAQMLLYYACLLALVAGIAVSRHVRGFVPVMLFCIVIVTIYGIAIPNVGTLYRERMFSVFLLCGAGLPILLDLLQGRYRALRA